MIARSDPPRSAPTSHDSVKIYDLSSATEINSLIAQYSPTITVLSFYTPANLSLPCNLISTVANKAICIYNSDLLCCSKH
uniref:Uncharacterized protein n=1 Tax=Kalanchoe fedtschenkoi TaxID=63787 RepID=A0A7N0USH4_KALFE